jgi:cytidine deaminase
MSADSITPVTPPPGMPAEDIRLLEIAQALLARVWVQGRHEVATALRAGDGNIYTGVHLEGSCRRSSICAEGVALGTARAGLEPGSPLRIDTVVSVQIKPAGQFRIIAPCGVCRELISDYSPDTKIWITADAGIIAVAAQDLLPHKTRRVWLMDKL